MKAKRNSEKVKKVLSDLTNAAKTGQGNLLEIAIEAAKERATIGEISDALEEVYGRHVPKDNIVRGAYATESTQKGGEKGKNDFENAFGRVKDFAKKDGRNPRILVAKMGQDGHDRGAKVISSGFADLGFDVDVGGLFSTPEEVA